MAVVSVAVAVSDVDAGRVEELLDLSGKRRPGAGQKPDPPPHDALQLSQDEGLGRQPLEPETGRKELLFLPAQVDRLSHAEGPEKKLLAPALAVVEFFKDGRVDLLVETGHGAHDRGPDLPEVIDDF